jgi:maltose O-acetyltransferase
MVSCYEFLPAVFYGSCGVFWGYMIRHFCCFVLFCLPPTRLFFIRRFLLRCSGVEVDDRTSFCGRGWIYGRGQLHIGAETWLSPGVIVHTHVNANIHIGDRCDIGPGVEFIPGSHIIGNASRRAGEGTAKPITVGNGTWIGAKSVILGGVNIGEGCVVAAGSVVTHDVPSNSLVAGVPARIRRLLSQ